MDKLYVAKIVSSTSTDGVGLRNSLYLSGCHLKCKGCHNSAWWDIKSGEAMTLNKVFKKLNKDDFNISILGGEPILQYPALLKLCKKIKAETNKTIWLWTGYELPYLEIFYGDILKYIDMVVDGPFIQDLKSPNLKWRGSTNQNIYEIIHSKTNNTIKINKIDI